MLGHSDDKVEANLKWKLARNGFPQGVPKECLYLYADALAADKVPVEMGRTAAASESGKPVIAIIGNEDYWTLFSTNTIASRNQFGYSTVNIDQIEAFSPVPREQPKETLQNFEITTKAGQVAFVWAPPGICFGILGGLLLMLKRMQQS